MFTCTKCDAQSPKWQGRCNECGSWGTLVESSGSANKKEDKKTPAKATVNLKNISSLDQARLSTGLSEFDRVLGGGIVKGSLVLLGGDPGIGKSTLALQIANHLPNLLYISGEESAQQVKLRAERLRINLDNLAFLPETDIETITATIKEQKPPLVIIDSIQTMNYAEANGGIGSVAQITICTSKLLEVAKTTNVPIIIVGHVTKEGVVAGPKVLEHLVDTVLYLEHDNRNFYKILRGIKNRFGSTGEIGVFEMTSLGLKEILNPADIFLLDKNETVPGMATSSVIEGTRPFLVEVQALVSKTNFGYPQRRATGFDLNRLEMLIAVISKIAKINLGTQDVYLNVAGGLKIKDPSIDLAVCLAIVSAYLDIAISNKTLIVGEVGLAGEVRPVTQTELRIKEAQKLSFTNIICPKGKDKLTEKISTVSNISEAIKLLK
ncbi:MAG: DNA repair protein RadA [bacterium]